MAPRRTLTVVCIATAMLMLDIAVVNTALSHISRDLHPSLAGLEWIVSAYTLSLATVVLSFGSLADRFGRRRLFSVGVALFGLSSRPEQSQTGRSSDLGSVGCSGPS